MQPDNPTNNQPNIQPEPITYQQPIINSPNLQSNTPVQPVTPQYNDQFNFLNESHSPKINFNQFSGNLKGRIIVVSIGAFILLIAFLIFSSLLSNNSTVNLPSLTTVVGEQIELQNLANTGAQQSQNYLNLAYTTLGSVDTNHQQLTSLLTKNGLSINPAQIVGQPNITNQLNQAQQISNFDNVYAQVMKQQFSLYLSDLSNAYKLNPSKIIRSYLSTDYQDTQLLIKMLNEPYDLS